MSNLDQAVSALKRGEVIAYPTEGVFGLGCDPDNPQAIQQLLTIKQRAKEKGLILIAGSFEQLAPYVDIHSLSESRRQQIFASWPGAVTWVLPTSKKTSDWVSGQFDTVAVRVTDHSQVIDLCQAFGKPLISTSANLSGQPAALCYEEVVAQLGNQLDTILQGQTGGRKKPSKIIDGRSGQIFRE
ncbi:L-threonylcarbamoyladenylate synthase [Celerinatantimonas diazotrophica]|uniref:L-threonylcarbamoyladenylate synthase n=1 Tax=Celerinatantimonas diazotrophica TaxID=412034 RepID=UPI00104FDC91|nr:L-threonylcarbamoyladenylate synthase [Celerinatantimonas diazotrophica]